MSNTVPPSGERTDKWQRALDATVSTLKTTKFWSELFIMTAAVFMCAVAIHFFLYPSGIITGSATGVAIVFNRLMPGITTGNFILIINVLLLIVAFVILGPEFGAKTVYTSIILGPFVDFLADVAPIEGSLFATEIAGTMYSDLWSDALWFVLIIGIAQAILFSVNASTGGLDIVGKIITKYTHMPIGTSVAIVGILSCFTALLTSSLGNVLMGILVTWINGLIIDYFMSKMSTKIRVMIVVDDPTKTKDYILHTINRGVTIHEVYGGYTGKKKYQLETELDQKDFTKLRQYLSTTTENTFVTADPVSDVYGIWREKPHLKQLEEEAEVESTVTIPNSRRIKPE